jgi:hypothetical protein
MHSQENLRKIRDRRTTGDAGIKAFDTSVQTAVKPASVLLDELHEIAKAPAAERGISQPSLWPAAQPRRLFDIHHEQSDEPPRGAFRSELAVARAISDGVRKARCCRSCTSSLNAD